MTLKVKLAVILIGQKVNNNERMWYCGWYWKVVLHIIVVLLLSVSIVTEGGGVIHFESHGRKDLLWPSVVLLSCFSQQLKVFWDDFRVASCREWAILSIIWCCFLSILLWHLHQRSYCVWWHQVPSPCCPRTLYCDSKWLWWGREHLQHGSAEAERSESPEKYRHIWHFL